MCSFEQSTIDLVVDGWKNWCVDSQCGWIWMETDADAEKTETETEMEIEMEMDMIWINAWMRKL